MGTWESTAATQDDTDSGELTLGQSLIMELLTSLTESDFKDIYGVKNIQKVKNVKKESLEVKSIKSGIVHATLVSSTGHAHDLEINFQKNLNKSKCSCREYYQGRKRKQCEHLAAAVKILKEDPSPILDHEIEDGGKPTYAPEEIAKLREEARTRKENLKNLDLDPELIEEVFQEVEDVILTLTLQGLQRMSKNTLEWLNSIEIRTQIAKLANITKELKKIEELIKYYLEKSPLFDMQVYRYRLNQLINYYLLAKRLINGGEIKHDDVTPETIIGKFRSSYLPAEDIIAQCIGMTGWKSSDGNMIGTTGYYLDLSRVKLLAITQALPTMYFGNDPKSVFKNNIKSVNFSMQDLAHGAFKFTTVKLNDRGNISLHKNLSIYRQPVKMLNTNESFKIFRIRDWLKLVDVVCSKEQTPIRLPYQLDNYYVLDPAKWGKFTFDPIKQEYSAKLLDEQKNIIFLLVTNEEHNRKTIKNLQEIFNKPDMMPQAVLGTVFVKDGYISINPITLFWYQGIRLKSIRGNKLVSEFHLNLENASELTMI
ncbi:hypothetical protein GF325_11225 [Candidatus Bathyarchaeota archaeon]|nr:hypothetical protein [Candidatus Bathyarchaeota archaeon]